MASEDRPASDHLTWLERLAREPGSFDFHAVLRRFEASFPATPRLGEAVRPADEPLRIGQSPSLRFQSTAVAGFEPAVASDPARLLVGFLGLWGPQGPLPIHLTEYAHDRASHAGDTTLEGFVDLFHQRMLLMFHRAWAKAQPTASMDRPDSDRFAVYVGAFLGLALRATRDRDAFPDHAKLFYAGRLAPSARNAEGLREIVADYFGVPAAIEEFVGEWLDLPAGARWELGRNPETGTLGRSIVLGARAWTRSHKFRIVLGPLSRFELERTLPSSSGMETLSAIVRLYTNDEWDWDVCLVLAPEATEAMRLRGGARLGWTTRVGTSLGAREHLIVDPHLYRTRRVRAPASTH
jgi:type VI secretion system protein ImpH